MKTSYEERAKKFIRQFNPFYEDFSDIEEAVSFFNMVKHRHVKISSGCTRDVLITSDYVIKLDIPGCPYDCFGSCKTEYANYQLAVRDGFDYLFAKITCYEYEGIKWYIMPRIRYIGRYPYNAECYLTEKENNWLDDNGFFDLHHLNYGWKDDKVVLIDYASRSR